MNSKYYKESGNMTLLNFTLAVIISVIVSFILGHTYSLLIHYIPVIYFNIAITVGLGIGLSLLVRLLIRIGKIRGEHHRYIIAGLVILSTQFFQWITYIDAIALNRFPSFTESITAINWLLQPGDLFHIIGQIYEHGTWGIGTRGQFQVNGILLAMIWLGEAIIIAFPTIKSQNNFKSYPFSEKFDKWYPKYTIDEYFESIYSEKTIVPELDLDVINTLRNLKLANKARCSRIHIYYIENEVNHYLSIDKVWIEGKGNTKEVRVLNNYRIETNTLNEIKDSFKLNRERIDIL